MASLLAAIINQSDRPPSGTLVHCWSWCLRARQESLWAEARANCALARDSDDRAQRILLSSQLEPLVALNQINDLSKNGPSHFHHTLTRHGAPKSHQRNGGAMLSNLEEFSFALLVNGRQSGFFTFISAIIPTQCGSSSTRFARLPLHSIRAALEGQLPRSSSEHLAPTPNRHLGGPL